MAPPAAKKRKSGVGIDFKKARHKVGRKLPPPQNATKVEFKTKAIVLPGQSIGLQKDGIAVNQRNKTLKELFTQISHYSDRVRKDALLGMKELFQLHPKELEGNVTPVIDKLAGRFTEVDKSVRQALLVLLRSVFLAVPKVAMKPHIKLVMAQLGSAMTHMSTEIRSSAFSILDLLLQQYSSLLSSYNSQIISYFEHTLGEAGLDTNTVLTVLSTLTRFLPTLRVPAHDNRSLTGLTHQWGEKYDIEKARQGSSEELRALHWYRCSVEPVVADDSLNYTERMTMCSSLVQVLLKCWADCVPTVCSSPLPDEAGLDCMVHIANSLCMIFDWLKGSSQSPDRLRAQSSDRYLWRVDLRHKFWSSFTMRFMAPFPVPAPSVRVSSKVEEGLCELNVAVCKVMLHFLVPSHLGSSSAVDGLLQYYEDALAGRLLPVPDYSSISTVRETVIEKHVQALLSYIPSVVDCVEVKWKIKILKVVTKIFESAMPHSGVKVACLSTMSRVLLSENWLQGEDDPSTRSMRDEFSKMWLQLFPKFLWELRSERPSCSMLVLKMIHSVGTSARAGSPLAEEYARLQTAMLPFFCSMVPTKQAQVKRIYSPFVKLPTDCQSLAVDLLCYFTDFQAPFLKGLASCCLYPSVDTQVSIRLIEVLQTVYARGDIKLEVYLSFILTLLSDPGLEKRYNVVGALCNSLSRLGDTEVVLRIMADALAEQLRGMSSSSTLSNFLRVVASLSHGNSGKFSLPAPLQHVLPQQTAECLVSELRNTTAVSPVLGYSIVLIYRSQQFAASLMKALVGLLAADAERVAVIVKILACIVKQDGIEQSLVPSDVRRVLEAVKEAQPKSSPEHRQIVEGLLCPLEAGVAALLGS